jgi:hypothetical protein
MEHLEVFGMRVNDLAGCIGWLVSVWFHATDRVGSLEKILLNKVREVGVPNPLTKTMHAARVIWGYTQDG